MASNTAFYAFGVHSMQPGPGAPCPLLTPATHAESPVLVKLVRFESPEAYLEHAVQARRAVQAAILDVKLDLPENVDLKSALAGRDVIMKWATRVAHRITVRPDPLDDETRRLAPVLRPTLNAYTDVADHFKAAPTLVTRHTLSVTHCASDLAAPGIQKGRPVPGAMEYARGLARTLSAFIDWRRVAGIASTMPLLFDDQAVPLLDTAVLSLTYRFDVWRSLADVEALFDVFNAQLVAHVPPGQLRTLRVQGPRRTLRPVYNLPAVLLTPDAKVVLSDVSVTAAPGTPRNHPLGTLRLMASAVPTESALFRTSVHANLDGFGVIDNLHIGYNVSIWSWPHEAVVCLVHLDNNVIGLCTDSLVWKRSQPPRSRKFTAACRALARKEFAHALRSNPGSGLVEDNWRTVPIGAVAHMLSNPTVQVRDTAGPVDTRYDKNHQGPSPANVAMLEAAIVVQPSRLPRLLPIVLGHYADANASKAALALWQGFFGQAYKPALRVIGGAYTDLLPASPEALESIRRATDHMADYVLRDTEGFLKQAKALIVLGNAF